MLHSAPFAIQEVVVNGPLGKSGFLAAFSLIFLSEIGDKTFFIAALLAMKIGKWMSFIGSVSALAVMTVISVGIGAIFSRVPDALRSSIPIGELAGVALLVFFGVKALRVSPLPAAYVRHGAGTLSLEESPLLYQAVARRVPSFTQLLTVMHNATNRIARTRGSVSCPACAPSL